MATNPDYPRVLPFWSAPGSENGPRVAATRSIFRSDMEECEIRTSPLKAALLLLFWLQPSFGLAQSLTFREQASIPNWVESAVTRAGLDKHLVFEARLNPFYQRGDFDGDGAADFALLVKERASGTIGIAVVHRRTGRVFVVGAGRSVGNGGDDFEWMDAWMVVDKGPVSRGVTAERPPVLRGDALLVSKTESASAILWWNGTSYRWYQQGD